MYYQCHVIEPLTWCTRPWWGCSDTQCSAWPPAWCCSCTPGSPSSLGCWQPIRGQYSGHVTSIDQWKVSIKVIWSLLTNQRPVFRSHDLYWLIRDQYLPAWGGAVTGHPWAQSWAQGRERRAFRRKRTYICHMSSTLRSAQIYISESTVQYKQKRFLAAKTQLNKS